MAHGFAAAGNNNIRPAGTDFRRSIGNGLKTGRTKNGLQSSGNSDRQARSHSNSPPKNHALLSFRKRAANNQIIYFFRLYFRNSRYQAFDYLDTIGIRPGCGKTASFITAAWTSYGFNNYSITHDFPPSFLEGAEAFFVFSNRRA